MATIATFCLEDWQAEKIDDAFPDDDEFHHGPYHGKGGMMVGQIRRGNGCYYAIFGYMPNFHAKKIKAIVTDFEKRWLLRPFRHMWE